VEKKDLEFESNKTTKQERDASTAMISEEDCALCRCFGVVVFADATYEDELNHEVTGGC